MMAGYTPTMDELRRIYVDATEGHREDCPDDDERAAEFNRAIAAVEAAVRAVALTDAADEYESRWGLDGVPEWLRERAQLPVTESEVADLTYVVCNRLLDAETNEHCEFDGDVKLDAKRSWRCPGCRARRYEPELPVTGLDTEKRRAMTIIPRCSEVGSLGEQCLLPPTQHDRHRGWWNGVETCWTATSVSWLDTPEGQATT